MQYLIRYWQKMHVSTSVLYKYIDQKHVMFAYTQPPWI